jgi:transcription elongation factor Elf1
MIPQEAIEWLIAIEKKYIFGGDEGFDNQRKAAIKTAVFALEKQIPKKPIWDMGWACPNCNNYEIQHFIKRPDWDDLFCKNCGQALDWSDTE